MQDTSAVLIYIDKYWDKIIYPAKESRNNPHIIPLPHAFISPNAKESSHWKGAMFYWDSFFMFRGLLGSKREKVIPGMVDNFLYLLDEYGIIPNANFWGFLTSSQPPFLSSMLWDGYYVVQREKGIGAARTWLRKRLLGVIKEYWQVWEDDMYYHHKITSLGLNTYGDRDVGYHWNAERESGWDFTSRFYNSCHDFLPIDLQSFLYVYEKDFARAYNILRRDKEEAFWEKRAKKRQQLIKKYMWNNTKGFFFDYDHVHKTQSDFYSLAGFTPMWAGFVTQNEAKKMREKLQLFETPYGLTITARISHPKSLTEPKQWDYPNIWSPLEYLTVVGLLKYGFIQDAVRIMQKSIATHTKLFTKYNALLEKLDATTGDQPKAYWYPTQIGFGWTNATYYRYVQLLKAIEKSESPFSLDGVIV